MSDRTYLSGASLAGMSPSRSRVKDDFYATPFYMQQRLWSSTMCFAWFVWEHGFTGEPGIRWL